MVRSSIPKKRKVARQSALSPEIPDTGPVTLEQARALAGVSTMAPAAETPKPALATMRSVPGTAHAEGPSLGVVAVERRKLRLQQKEERTQRTRDYKATMAIMKKRGVKGLNNLESLPAPSGAGRRRSAMTEAAKRPLQVLAEGDSWFDYPVPLFGGGIVPRLERLIGVPILNMAKAGDEVRFMLGVEERKLLSSRLSAGCPAGGAWDVLLFSGGGNDIVANPMALWIKDFDSTLPPEQHLHAARFKAALALVQAGYEDLIEIRNRLSPNTHLVFHGYDFALPDGRGICHLGPWLKPTFDVRGFPGIEAATAVVRIMLQQFAAVLQKLQQGNKGVSFLHTQGTLPAQKASWHNELHPAKAGFNQFARMFHAELKALFPASVLG